MKTEKEIRAKLREIRSDDRMKSPPALVQINAPLALIQTRYEGQVDILEWVLEKGGN